MGTAEKSPPEKTSRPVPGDGACRILEETPAGEYQAAPGYEAQRFKVGTRVVRALKALPWWVKALPTVVGTVFVATLCAGKVTGNPASQGGFSDTETAVVAELTGAVPECPGGGDGGGGCAVGESIYGHPALSLLSAGCGGNGGGGKGNPGQNGDGNGNGGNPGENGSENGASGGNGGGNAAGEGNSSGNTGSAPDNSGSIYGGAAENAALATGATDTPGDTGGAGTGDPAGSGGQAGDDAGSGSGGGNSGPGG